ncbi:MAG: UDP-N-acetylglucosamine 2-epimerase (non-hydrolyzing) [Chloroflexi bacterium]|nr:UDP-N-acetylglucosamine 2-epimerase (non-hydrolyzing) [Chloroflexota bacterium]
MRVLHVVGARPNFMKIAPIMREMAKYPHEFEQILVHTGQHYDDNMSKVFFEDLELPQPDIYLGVGSGSHAQQTARIMLAFEPVLLEYKPDWVIVVGDVNSTVACALTAAKLGVKVAHVEAGLRSFDRTMPEEFNRVLTDHIADLLFTTEPSANENLRQEGIPEGKVHFVGNVMIDTLLRHKERALALNILGKYGLESRGFALLTLHRPSNVDVPEVLAGILDALSEIQARLPVLFPAHPRTVERIREFGFEGRLVGMQNLRMTEPLGYLEFLNLMANARLVLTDSGGIQEETTILGVPCLTLRENTERPVTVTQGTNTVVGSDPQRIVAEALAVLDGKSKAGRVLELWDGRAAERIVAFLSEVAE